MKQGGKRTQRGKANKLLSVTSPQKKKRIKRNNPFPNTHEQNRIRTDFKTIRR